MFYRYVIKKSKLNYLSRFCQTSRGIRDYN